MKKIIILSIVFLNYLSLPSFSKNDLYEKIDLFGEVLETKGGGWPKRVKCLVSNRHPPLPSRPTFRERNCTRQSSQQQRGIAKQAEKVDANHFFNLLTSPQLLEVVEASLPEHRERDYPPTKTLWMFLGQVMSADGSCQNTVNEAVVTQLLSGLPVASVNTGGYCTARQRLPQAMVSSLARQTGRLLGTQTPGSWQWRGRHVKLVDSTTIVMPDTNDNQARYPQHGQQAPGFGFPLARFVGVISLTHGAVLDAAMGPYQGKGTGEYGLFRRLKESFVEGDVMLADGYYCSYFLIADMQARGVDVLFEQHGARHTDFRTGRDWALGIIGSNGASQLPNRLG